jgi:hypothetical protein
MRSHVAPCLSLPLSRSIVRLWRISRAGTVTRRAAVRRAATTRAPPSPPAAAWRPGATPALGPHGRPCSRASGARRLARGSAATPGRRPEGRPPRQPRVEPPCGTRPRGGEAGDGGRRGLEPVQAEVSWTVLAEHRQRGRNSVGRPRLRAALGAVARVLGRAVRVEVPEALGADRGRARQTKRRRCGRQRGGIAAQRRVLTQSHTGADALQRPLRSRFRARLTAGVRLPLSKLCVEGNLSRVASLAYDAPRTDIGLDLMNGYWIRSHGIASVLGFTG